MKYRLDLGERAEEFDTLEEAQARVWTAKILHSDPMSSLFGTLVRFDRVEWEFNIEYSARQKKWYLWQGSAYLDEVDDYHPVHVFEIWLPKEWV